MPIPHDAISVVPAPVPRARSCFRQRPRRPARLRHLHRRRKRCAAGDRRQRPCEARRVKVAEQAAEERQAEQPRIDRGLERRAAQCRDPTERGGGDQQRDQPPPIGGEAGDGDHRAGQEGQLLAELDSSQLEVQVSIQQANVDRLKNDIESQEMQLADMRRQFERSVQLHERGLLENTLVVWMGEFGRTPKFKSDGGREHYAEGWLVGLSGAGVRGGQVIGATDAEGVHVTDRPVSVQDLFATFCHVLSIDPHEEYLTTDRRPIKIVDGGQVLAELFS